MFQRILLPIDLGHAESQVKAAKAAAAMAAADNAKLWVINVVPEFGTAFVGAQFPDDFAEKARAAALEELRAFAGRHIAGSEPDFIVGEGAACHEISRAAEDRDVDLIVMASHRPAFRDHLIGPNAAHVMTHSNCSVLVVRQ